ncbi:hypothetical protein Tco_0531574 [Tanacetum coccineum]
MRTEVLQDTLGILLWGPDSPEAPPASPDYVPGPEEPEQAPLSPDYVPGPEYPEYLAPSNEEVPIEDQPYAVDGFPIDYPADGGDGDDDDSSDDDEEEEVASKEAEMCIWLPATLVGCTVVDKVPILRRQSRLRLMRGGERFLAYHTTPPSPLHLTNTALAVESLYRAAMGKSSNYSLGPARGHGIDYGFIGTLDAETRRQRAEEVGYGIRDVWVDLTEAVEEVAPTTLEGVNARVTNVAAVQEQDTPDVYAGQLSAALGQIQALQARGQTHADDHEGYWAGCSGYAYEQAVTD